MVNYPQYRHYIYVSLPTEPVEDETGGLLPATASWEYYARGRYEENGQGSVITLPDGKTVVFSGVVYTRPGFGKLPIGTRIRVEETPEQGEDVRFEGMVVNMAPNMFNAKIYVNQQ